MDLFRFREKHTFTGCEPSQKASARAMECGVARFSSWINSYANEWEDHPNHWGTTHSSVFWQCLGAVLPPLGVSFSLQIGDQGLVEFDLSSWTHLIVIGFYHALVLSFFQKLSPAPFPPVSCSFPKPCWAHNVAPIIFQRDNQKIAGPWGRITV